MSKLVVLTTYYNPCHYASRRKNYDVFMEGMRKAGVTCITIECAFGSAPFELPSTLDTIRVRSDTLLWQKERLLNLAESWLPSTCEYVGWFDCDILFDNANWARDLVAVMGHNKVAQCFETCLQLGPDGLPAEPEVRSRSFASVMATDPGSLDCGRYDRHGHTGFSWCATRQVFSEVGLYEHAISGSSDHFMAHGIFGHWGFCVENALKNDPKQINHLKEWGQRFFKLVNGSLGFVPGEIRHLWHGDTANRRYFLRMHDITDLDFDPYSDIVATPGRPLEWAPSMQKPALKQYFVNYFTSRLEDGPHVPATGL